MITFISCSFKGCAEPIVKFTLFRKLLLFFISVLVIISILFTIIEKVSHNVLQRTLQTTSHNQLEYSMQEMEQTLKQLEILMVLLSNDSSIKSYGNSKDFSPYLNSLLLRKTIEEKLLTQSYANIVQSNISVYWPSLNEVLSSLTYSPKKIYDKEHWQELPKFKWFISRENGFELRYILVDPYTNVPELKNVNYTIETSLTVNFLKNVLRSVEATGNGSSFFYNPSSEPIYADHFNEAVYQEVRALYASDHFKDGDLNHQTIKIDNKSYLLQAVSSTSLGWSLVQYIPLDDYLKPLNLTKKISKASLLFLIVIGSIMYVILYRNIKRPITYLVRKLEALGRGEYDSRVHLRVNNEFDYLFDQFNDMASRIQILIEDVYEEKLRSREAVYKQLQSQINPHFLYNCLFYIVSMAKKNPDAVTEMAQNLAYYYRFITKNNSYEIPLSEELKLITSYLSVQTLRNPNIHYQIDMEECMKHLLIPPLILQPIVENCVVHGIDNKLGSGIITIKGLTIQDVHHIIVEDDGYGLTPEQIHHLQGQLENKYRDNEIGCGLWNIDQRMKHRYDQTSGLTFEVSELGGLKVTLSWTRI
ncbi:sensor histidine kinase [Paenibacillus sp. CMAA1364]